MQAERLTCPNPGCAAQISEFARQCPKCGILIVEAAAEASRRTEPPVLPTVQARYTEYGVDDKQSSVASFEPSPAAPAQLLQGNQHRPIAPRRAAGWCWGAAIMGGILGAIMGTVAGEVLIDTLHVTSAGHADPIQFFGPVLGAVVFSVVAYWLTRRVLR
jgi:hypothetical protein